MYIWYSSTLNYVFFLRQKVLYLSRTFAPPFGEHGKRLGVEGDQQTQQAKGHHGGLAQQLGEQVGVAPNLKQPVPVVLIAQDAFNSDNVPKKVGVGRLKN